MKHVLITVLIALIASLLWCFLLRAKNYELKSEIKQQAIEVLTSQKANTLKVDSIQREYDSLLLQKAIVRVKNHYKIVEKQKLVEIYKTDSNYIPIEFNPEYQLLACMYDSIYFDKEFTENMLLVRNEQVKTFANMADSLNFELKKYHKLFLGLFFKK